NSARIKKRRLRRLGRKNQTIRGTSHTQPLLDAIAGLLSCQRGCFATYSHALLNLPQFGATEFVLQFRLSGKNNLEEFAVRGLQIKQQPDFLKGVGRKPLRLINHQHCGPSSPMNVKQPSVQSSEGDVHLSLARDIKLRKHQFEKLATSQVRIHNQSFWRSFAFEPGNQIIEER